MIGYVIGDIDMITGFRLVGVEGAEVTTVMEAKQALQHALSRSDVAIIVISEAYSTDPVIHEQIDRVRQERVSPLIVELPGSRGTFKGIPISNTISKILGIKI
jgi:V/A-type H+-transporting ATPase subunit F